ncbi:MAG: hypothetical protein ACRDRN_17400 [Sciscionella sp.]
MIALSGLAASAAPLLADLVPDGGKGGQGEAFGKAAPVALIVIVLFFIAVAFLIRSMTKHLKKVPASFDPEERARLEAEAAKAAEAGEPQPKPMNSVRAKAMARAEARARAAEPNAPESDTT